MHRALRDRLYAILPGPEGDPVGRATYLSRAGWRLFQLRCKDLGDRALLELTRQVRAALPDDACLLVNDRVAVAQLAADGVHLGAEDLPVRAVRRLLGPKALIGATAHNAAQAVQAERDGADYLGVGTVFASSTKPERPVAGLALLRAVLAEVSLPVYAIGGITSARAEQVLACGVHGLALGAALGDDAQAFVLRERLPLQVDLSAEEA